MLSGCGIQRSAYNSPGPSASITVSSAVIRAEFARLGEHRIALSLSGRELKADR
jgi:hypothetical protein